MLNRFDTLFEKIYNTTNASGMAPVVYIMPDDFTDQQCEELSRFFEQNGTIWEKITNFLKDNPKPNATKETHNQWIGLWNEIIGTAHDKGALGSIISTVDVPNSNNLQLTAQSKSDIEKLRDWVVQRFSGGRLNYVMRPIRHNTSQPTKTPVDGNKKTPTELSSYDDFLRRVDPINHLSYDAWEQKRFGI
jgi:hypothetical protein